MEKMPIQKENFESDVDLKKKKTIKRTVVIIIILLLAMLMGMTVFAGTQPEILLIDGFYCTKNNRDGYTIVGIDGLQQNKTLVIPQTLNGVPVDEIASAAFFDSGMKHFIVPSSIKYIGKNAFDGEGVFYVYMVGRKNLDGMHLEENWSGVGEVIFQDVNPNIEAPPSVKKVEDFINSDLSNNNVNINQDGDPNGNADGSNGDGTTDGDPLPDIKNDITNNVDGDSADKDFVKEQNRKLARIEILSTPKKTAYVELEKFDAAGMVVKAVYDDGFSQLVTDFTFNTNPLALDTTSMIISFKDGETVSARVPITVMSRTPVRLIIEKPPKKTAYVELEKFDAAGMVFTCEYNNGEKKTVTPIYENDSLILNQPNVLFTYTERGTSISATQNISVVQKTPVRLTIKTPPKKTEYIETTDIDTDGIEFEVSYNNGEKSFPTACAYDKTKVVFGQKQIVFTYREKGKSISANQPIAVRKRLPTKLEITAPPKKTDYIEEEHFLYAGTAIKASYDNGTEAMVTASFNDIEVVYGQKEIAFLYTENGTTQRVNQPITVRKRLPITLTIQTPPKKTDYIEGNLFDKSGMEVSALYDNGKTYPIKTYTYSNSKIPFGQAFVTLSYTENSSSPVTVNQPISVRKKLPTKLEITAPPQKTAYIEGNLFDKSGMEITAHFDNGDIEKVTDFSCAPTKKLQMSDSFIVVSYTKNGTTQSINQPIAVRKRLPTKLEITAPPKKTDYIEDMIFLPESMEVTAHFDNGDIEKVTDYTYPKTDILYNQNVVIISYEESGVTVKADVQIKVKRKSPVSISILDTSTCRVKYPEEMVFDNSGMLMEAVYDNGKTYPITRFTTPTNEMPYGQKSVVVSYQENESPLLTASQAVIITKKLPINLSLKGTAVRQIEEIPFDDTGLSFEVTYDNQKTESVVAIDKNSADILTVGTVEKTWTFNKNGNDITVQKSFQVFSKQLRALIVTREPSKKEYIEDEYFAPANMATKVTYDNKKEKSVTATFVNKKLVPSDTSVELSYTENGKKVTATQKITVLYAVPDSISIDRNPNQTSYDAGRVFRPAGMIVNGHYRNGAVRQITDYTYPNQLLTHGQSYVTISHTSRGTTRTAPCYISVGAQQAVYEKYYAEEYTEYEYFTTTSFAGEDYWLKLYDPVYLGDDVHYSPKRGLSVDNLSSNVSSGWYADASWQVYYIEKINRISGAGIQRTEGLVDRKLFCEHTTVENKGTYISSITADKGAYPSDGYSEGSWYVLSYLVTDTLSLRASSEPAFKPYVEKKSTCTYEKWTVKNGIKQTYLAEVQAPTGSLPSNGIHTDGSWYVLKTP